MGLVTGNAHAVVMRHYGAPEVLTHASVAVSALGPDEVRIRTIVAAINHTDLEIRAGTWPVLKDDPFPYVPGIEVVGDVAEVGAAVRSVREGDRVITMMQGLGGVRALRAGGYAEYVTVAAATLAPVPSGLAPAPGWVDAFADWMSGAIEAGRTQDLIAYRRLGPHAARNHPTEEHLLPLFVALGAGEGGVPEHLHQSTTHGVLRMDAFAFGRAA